jgi:hypothetical protein
MCKRISDLYGKVASKPWLPYPWKTKEWKDLDKPAAGSDNKSTIE